MNLTLSVPDCLGCCCPVTVEYQLTVADVVLCGCLANGGGFGNSILWNPLIVPDGVYTLVGGAGTNLWSTFTPFSADFDYFTSGNCSTGGSTNGEPNPFQFYMACDGGQMSLRILVQSNISRAVASGRYPYFFLARDLTIGTPANNDLGACDTTDTDETPGFTNIPFVSGSGGTVLVEPMP